MLKITDLTVSKELESKEMAGVRGGTSVPSLPFPFPSIDFSTGITNKVADVEQAFAFNFAQANAGEVINNQAIQGGNGFVKAPVTQTQNQHNEMFVSGIGTISVS